MDQDYGKIEKELITNRESINEGLYAQKMGLDKEQAVVYLEVLREMTNNFNQVFPTGNIDNRVLTREDII